VIFRNARDILRYSTGEATLITVQFSDRSIHVLWNDTFEAGQFLIYPGPVGEVTVSDSVGNLWSQPVESLGGTSAAVIDALPAEKVDMDWVVVAGPVRMITLPDGPRPVAFRSASGAVTRLNP
jgi:hypothetical protein